MCLKNVQVKMPKEVYSQGNSHDLELPLLALISSLVAEFCGVQKIRFPPIFLSPSCWTNNQIEETD